MLEKAARKRKKKVENAVSTKQKLIIFYSSSRSTKTVLITYLFHLPIDRWCGVDVAQFVHSHVHSSQRYVIDSFVCCAERIPTMHFVNSKNDRLSWKLCDREFYSHRDIACTAYSIEKLYYFILLLFSFIHSFRLSVVRARDKDCALVHCVARAMLSFLLLLCVQKNLQNVPFSVLFWHSLAHFPNN